MSKNELKLLSIIPNIFLNRTLVLVLPMHLIEEWTDVSSYQIITFDNSFFASKQSYSTLLCSEIFYRAFIDFEYIQIIQTDCWVFNDQLDFFTGLGFDYIGAPWMEGTLDCNPQKKLWKVGNGGFSLRRVSTFLSVIQKINETEKGAQPVFKDNGKGLIKIFKQMGFRNNLRHYIKTPPGEDIFWSIYVPLVFNSLEFKIPDPKLAAHYAFETLPQYLFNEVTHGSLPMGCHNWMNNNPEFWNKHIP